MEDKKKVLIVEDDPVIVISLEFLMEENGYAVFIAKTGEEALELAEKHEPDLILLDVMLPQRTGFEVCQILRAQDKFEKTKIVLLTAKGREVDIKKGLTLGADAYITKPFSTRDLVKTVHDILADES
ncbi:MAG: response regulator [SAR324 cluster bacterium]|nr:response regulator [SAR324 cluster bacterium]